MDSVESIDFFEQLISQIFDLIPEIRTLEDIFPPRNRLCELCEGIIKKIEYKLHYTPYMPCNRSESKKP